MNRIVLHGTFGNGRDYTIWDVEDAPEQVAALTDLFHLELGIMRIVRDKTTPFFIHYYLLAERNTEVLAT